MSYDTDRVFFFNLKASERKLAKAENKSAIKTCPPSRLPVSRHLFIDTQINVKILNILKKWYRQFVLNEARKMNNVLFFITVYSEIIMAYVLQIPEIYKSRENGESEI